MQGPASPSSASAAIEAARIIPGHRFTAITEVYAEKDEEQAIEAMLQVG